jgi:choline dehydrogenase-like flavoprotein
VLIDARSIAEDSEIAADLCVIGAGPAGIAIVERLRNSGLQICLVESGGIDPEVSTQSLYRGSSIGHPYYRLDTCRYRLFGGTSNRWGGWCRPLDPQDFEQRDWIPWSGWPIGSQALEPYYAETARLFRLNSPSFELETWRHQMAEPYALQGDDFENIVVQICPKTNFAEAYGDAIISAKGVTTFLHANATGIELEPGTNRVARLRVQAIGRRPFRIRAKAMVLAAGGIENARLLLASRADRPAGLGNEHDLVGRFFMEHLNVPAGHVVAGPGGVNRGFFRKTDHRGTSLRGFISPTPAAQRRYRSAAISIAVEPLSYSFGTPCIGWPPRVTYGMIRLYRAFRRRNARPAEFARQLVTGAWSIPLRLRTLQTSLANSKDSRRLPETSRPEIYSLYVRAEQTPNPASRVLLSDRLDACGVPETRLDWRIEPRDIQSIETWLARLEETFAASGVGRIVMPAENWTEGIAGGPHHIGTTRMSADPKTGVVDEHCRVHSIANLYIAGSSVFATGGFVNPTFTMVALALRLADQLRDRLAK